MLSWTIEAYRRGLISSGGGVDSLNWGDLNSLLHILESIVNKTNEFYTTLSKDLRYAASVYGGEGFALQLLGNEIAGYHMGYAYSIGFRYGARHSRMDSSGYLLDQKYRGKLLNLLLFIQETN